MIEGLKVTVSAVELTDLCLKQAEFHDSRRATYAKNLENLVEAEIKGMNYSGGDPKRALQDKETEHANAADELRFIAAHLDASETYLLDGMALVKLGITKNRYGF